MLTHPVGSDEAQVHTPQRVPTSSSAVTMPKAPTYNKGMRPHRRKPNRHRYQNAPRASGCGDTHRPHTA